MHFISNLNPLWTEVQWLAKDSNWTQWDQKSVMEKKSLYLILLFQNVIFIMKKKLLLSTYLKYFNKNLLFNWRIRPPCWFTLAFASQTLWQTYSYFLQGFPRKQFFLKFYGKICDIFCYICRYLPTFLSHLKKLKSMPRILLEKFKRAFFTHFKMWKNTTTLHVKGHEILNFTFLNVKIFWLIFSMN